jgi:hypothetical protein
MAENLLLREFADQAVFARKLHPAAVADLLAIYGPKCIVDNGGVVTLEGKPLDEAINDLIATRPHWRPSQDVGDATEKHERAELMAKAENGNVSAFAKLKMTLPAKEFSDWQTRTGAVVGRKAVAPKTDAEKKQAAADNPWSDDSAEGNARRAEYIRKHGAKESANRAREAGRTLGGKLLPAGMRAA